VDHLKGLANDNNGCEFTKEENQVCDKAFEGSVDDYHCQELKAKTRLSDRSFTNKEKASSIKSGPVA